MYVKNNSPIQGRKQSSNKWDRDTVSVIKSQDTERLGGMKLAQKLRENFQKGFGLPIICLGFFPTNKYSAPSLLKQPLK